MALLVMIAEGAVRTSEKWEGSVSRIRVDLPCREKKTPYSIATDA